MSMAEKAESQCNINEKLWKAQWKLTNRKRNESEENLNGYVSNDSMASGYLWLKLMSSS